MHRYFASRDELDSENVVVPESVTQCNNKRDEMFFICSLKFSGVMFHISSA